MRAGRKWVYADTAGCLIGETFYIGKQENT